MDSKSHVVTKERMKSLQQKQTYVKYGPANNNGMQREVTNGILISKHGAKSDRFVILSQPVNNQAQKDDFSDDQILSQTTLKKVKFATNSPEKNEEPENNDEEPEKKKKRNPSPWIRKN